MESTEEMEMRSLREVVEGLTRNSVLYAAQVLKYSKNQEERQKFMSRKYINGNAVCGEIVEGLEPPGMCPYEAWSPKYFVKMEEAEEKVSDEKENIVIIGQVVPEWEQP